MYPTSSEPACDTVVCQLARLRHEWDPVAGWMIAALTVFIIVSVILLVVALTMLFRQARDVRRACARRAVDAWMAAVVEAQSLAVTAPSDEAFRAVAQRDLLRRIAVAEGASALDEAGPTIGAGESVRRRILLASETDDPALAEKYVRSCRTILRAWAHGDVDELRRSLALMPRT